MSNGKYKKILRGETQLAGSALFFSEHLHPRANGLVSEVTGAVNDAKTAKFHLLFQSVLSVNDILT